ncbi:DUF2887 domain-containing protein [Limnospira platensis]|uniref:DUF2887 domain-containing protein n=1 Tax=Limnospira platensis TaxID=118562 RepID=UPI0001D0F033|nr:hypothetical protein APPUASWS_001300 [Arthrospira platensis str. Paraca]MDF2209010.1 DUF2887 domain-containing protein [Arthrospira platensis NCB002]BAI87895.1 hypothetical protein NIES39_A00540 [Arthrospira platensis NIES-39]
MKTDKLFYRIFLWQPELIAELVPGIPMDCQFDYSAPVVKEQEQRIDGLFTPVGDDNPDLPLVFVEAQMQPDRGFYGRFFREVFMYLGQYEVSRPWRGLLIFSSRSQGFGVETPYRLLLDNLVERLYLEDLIGRSDLSPNLALLRLLVLPESETPQSARDLLNVEASEEVFQRRLDLVESIMASKFPQLSLEEIREMLDITQVRLEDTRFYRDVLQKGREEGREEAQTEMLLRQLTRRCGELSDMQRQQVISLNSGQKDELAEALLDFRGMEDFQHWLQR